MNLIEELKWRGMLHDIIPDTEEHFNTGKRTAYVGFDPTADSLHIGHLVSVMLLKHLEKHGHKGIALIGGATAMIGDPSGKSEERNLLDNTTIYNNIKGIELQFDSILGNVSVFNNKEWFQDFNFLDFIRDIGKHIPIGYMMGKTSVKKRIESQAGLSFTEFTYQLVQGYDFLHLYNNHNCTVQIGGADQWGNMTTGTELIRRVEQGKSFGFTCPLITKSDGQKFGKTESGTIWLDYEKTSPYKFFQFWMNTRDEDAEKYIKIFTMLEPNVIDDVISKHNENRGKRYLQTILASEVTSMVHGEDTTNHVMEASKVLFSNSVIDELNNMEEWLFNDIFEGVDKVKVEATKFNEKISLVDMMTEVGVFKSKREARDIIGAGGFYINNKKIEGIDKEVDFDFIKGKYMLLKRGKKKMFLLELV